MASLNVTIKGLTSFSTLEAIAGVLEGGEDVGGPTGDGGGHINLPLSKIMLPRTTSSARFMWK